MATPAKKKTTTGSKRKDDDDELESSSNKKKKSKTPRDIHEAIAYKTHGIITHRQTHKPSQHTLGGYGPAKTHYRKKSIIRAEGESDYISPYQFGAKKGGGDVANNSGAGGAVMERVIASGAVEAGVFALGAAGTAYFISTRTKPLDWALGFGLLSFFVAGGARNNAAVRDISLGVLGGCAATATLIVVGQTKLPATFP